MPFGSKNARSKAKKIMNDIFNDFQEFTIFYNDEVLVFSPNLEKHFTI